MIDEPKKTIFDEIKEEIISDEDVNCLTIIPAQIMEELKMSPIKYTESFDEDPPWKKHKKIKRKKLTRKDRTPDTSETLKSEFDNCSEESDFRLLVEDDVDEKSGGSSNTKPTSEINNSDRKKRGQKRHKKMKTLESENTSPNQQEEVALREDLSLTETDIKPDVETTYSRNDQAYESCVTSESTNTFRNKHPTPNRKRLISSNTITSSDDDEQVYQDLKNFEHCDSSKPNLTIEAADLEELLKVIEDEEALPHDVQHKLQGLKIKLRHEPPPQHMVENSSGSRGPTPEQKKLLKKLGPMKYGKFTPEEDDIIISNWKSFCKDHDWDKRNVKPFLYMRHRDAGFIAKFRERQKFTQYLAYKLPHRTLYSVYWRFRNLYQPHLQTRYTNEEDTLIKAHMENPATKDEKNVRKFSELAKILNRTRASVWRRYRLLKRMTKIEHGAHWDMSEVKMFLKNLMAITLSKNIDELKDVEFPNIVWDKMSKKMTLEAKELKEFWYTRLHAQLFSKGPIYLSDVKIKLIEFFYVKKIAKPLDNQWRMIAKHFDGMTPMFLCEVFNKLIGDERFHNIEWSEIIDYLYHVKKPEIQCKPKDKRLRRIAYNNGNPTLLDEKQGDKTA